MRLFDHPELQHLSNKERYCNAALVTGKFKAEDWTLYGTGEVELHKKHAKESPDVRFVVVIKKRVVILPQDWYKKRNLDKRVNQWCKEQHG
jgi:hypothetical protein